MKHNSKQFQVLIKILVFLLIISFGIAGASYIKQTSPKPRKRSPQKIIPLVETQSVLQSEEQIIISAMGTTIPAREIVLKSRISGEITNLHSEFIPGGYLKKEQDILQIEPEDYELQITQKLKQVANASYSLKLELGQQDIAKHEWKLINGNRPAKKLDKELALRKPHLEKAKADLEAAKAELNQARLDLSRTKIKAPFNAVVLEKNIEIGTQINSGEQLAELVGTDEYWIKVSIPVDRLKWIKIPRNSKDTGSQVIVKYRDEEYKRTGHVIRLLSDLEPQGRMARLLVAVNDPLNIENSDTNQAPLLLGEYVRVEIKGRKMTDVFRIPRTALRDDSSIWIAEKNKLIIRPVQTLWRDKNSVLLKNSLKNGEQLIISDLSTPVHGMTLNPAPGGTESIAYKNKVNKNGSK